MFFFQAEDGIRDAQESRGLGDVYKRQSLASFDALTYKQNLAPLVREVNPSLVLFGATFSGKSLAPRVATALEAGLTSNCTAIELQDDGSLLQVRPAFTGNFLAYVKTKSSPAMASVRYRALEAALKDSSRKGQIVKRPAVTTPTTIKVLGKGAPKEASIAAANVVVCAGRGLKKPEDVALVKKLADDGMSVTFISSELEEMLSICSRLFIMRDRKMVGELSGSQLSEDNIMKTIAGGERNGEGTQ